MYSVATQRPVSSEGAPVKLAEGIHYLSQEMGGHVHAFLLDDGNGITLIDALYDSDGKMILDELRAMGRQPSDLKNIIATHAHRSHIGGMAELKEQTNATVYAHEWEIGIIEGKRKSTKVSIWPKPPLAAYYTQFGLRWDLMDINRAWWTSL